MATSKITMAHAQGISGYDANGVRFGVFHGQIVDLKKTPSGCNIILETGEKISMDMCFNRLGKILKDTRGQ
ncbi:hypothetical protein NVP1077O_28 [Vibrio phage 1.077.O._10N.261.45.A10]|nr:hypothetical protein NVP1070O_28 [Vibrio phage 1.070.O._10N.261.45.B2]AUR85606.1 hypothetical protein NVP1077O_28 [Vibrio phage 1.077.O._10N.261.45.A10]